MKLIGSYIIGLLSLMQVEAKAENIKLNLNGLIPLSSEIEIELPWETTTGETTATKVILSLDSLKHIEAEEEEAVEDATFDNQEGNHYFIQTGRLNLQGIKEIGEEPEME